MTRREAILRRMSEISGAEFEKLALWYQFDPLEDLSPETLRCASEDFRDNIEQYRQVISG